MAGDITTLFRVDFEKFKFERIQLGLFNSLSMTQEQYDAVIDVLTKAKPEIENILASYSEPDPADMEMMGVKREEVGYRSIEVILALDETTHLPKQDWKYKVTYLTKDEKDANPGMAFGDRVYGRDLKEI